MALDTRADQARRRSMSLGGGGHAEVWLEPGSRVALHNNMEGSGSSGGGTSYWDKCKNAGCLGSVIDAEGLCYAHSSGDGRSLHLKEVESGRRVLDLRGNEIDLTLWSDVHRRVLQGVTVAVPMSFDGAVFAFKVRMQNVHYGRHVSWSGAIFEDGCEIRECKFDGGLSMSFTEFRRGPGYFQTCAIANLDARCCHTEQHVAFVACDIGGNVSARGVQKDFRLDDCTILKQCDLSQADTEHLSISGSRFEGELIISDANVNSFRASGTQLAAASVIGPLTTVAANMSNARFKCRVRLVVSGSNLNLAGASFDEGGRIECERARMDLSGLVVAGPLLVTGAHDASVVSMQNSDCGHLALSSVDLSRCRFYGCHDLQKIILESTVSLSLAPGPFRSKRRCIADELALRAARNRWRAKDWAEALGTEESAAPAGRVADALSPAQVASVYRSLRKSVEEQSDEPGACDYYYGEMEMRRIDRTKSPWERMLVWLYWVVSGYGLRGFRSLFWLLCALLSGSILMHAFGLKGHHSWADSLVSAAQSMVPGLTVSSRLANTGEAFEIVLRIVGPVLLGLAALALRNRVRR
jgi:uncharacterized protein YjbI with pentapeptide repeats